MGEITINIQNDQQRFFAGEVFNGTVDLVPTEDVPLTNVIVSFHCLGEVKWVEYPGTPYYLNGFVYYDKYCYLDKEFPIPNASKLNLFIPMSLSLIMSSRQHHLEEGGKGNCALFI